MADFRKEIETKYPYTTDCFLLKKQIEQLVSEQDFYRKRLDKEKADLVQNYLSSKKGWYSVFGCENYLSGQKAEIVGGLIKDYQKVDQERIIGQTKKDVIFRISIAIIVLSITIYSLVKKQKK